MCVKLCCDVFIYHGNALCRISLIKGYITGDLHTVLGLESVDPGFCSLNCAIASWFNFADETWNDVCERLRLA